MASNPADELAPAVALLRAQRLAEARAVLVEVVRRNPRADQAWFLLSLALEDPRQQRDCLTRALQLNPQHTLARERLAELDAAPEPAVPAPLAAAVPAAPKPEPPPAPRATAEPAPAAPRRGGWGCWLWGAVAVVALVAVTGAALAGLYWASTLAPTPIPVAAVPTVADTPTVETFPTLPPTWTATAVPSPTHTPTITPTPTVTPSPTLPAPGPSLAANMDRIDEQVADLRGLEIRGENPRYLVPRPQVEPLLRALVLSPNLQAELEDQQRVLSALGLIKPTYDLVKYALNSQADNIGGFYVPWTGEMFVIGSAFGGLERFIYSHEYTHALTDAHFNVDDLGVYPVCLEDAQRCTAIRALVEGDATLLMEQWWDQYATPQDLRDVLDYEPPRMVVPEEFPPPYIAMELAFPYEYGYQFVRYLHQRGNWAEVNRAYANLPQSTEHILHPETYLAGEAPVPVSLPPQPALAEGWRLVDEDVLGEWMTFLILGYGADRAAQLSDEQALEAAAGWGGDRYQVYHDPARDAAALVARWTWDTSRDGEEFARAMEAYLDQRFRGARLDRPGSACWESNGQASCLRWRGAEALWVLAPDQTVLNELLLSFPEF